MLNTSWERMLASEERSPPPRVEGSILVLTGEGSSLWEGGVQPLDRVVPTSFPLLRYHLVDSPRVTGGLPPPGSPVP